MAQINPAPPGRRRMSYFEVVQRRRETARERSRVTVCLGESFPRWRALKEQKSLKTDALVALFLLDSYKKLTEASSPENPEPDKSSLQKHYKTPKEKSSAENPEPAESRPQTEQKHDDAPRLLPTKCPACGFVLSQWNLRNGNAPNEERQPESIEVTLELEERDEPVSGAEEADGESDVPEDVEEESEGSEVNEESSDEDWTPALKETLTRSGQTWKAGEEEEEEEEENRKTEPGPGKRKLCTECGVFYQKDLHECEHKTKPFACIICGRRYVSDMALQVHNRIHTETYEYPCKYCCVGFISKADKLAHELVHQRQKDPFKCPECPQTFTTFGKRREHLQQHRDENPLKCDVCGIVFKMKMHFLRHTAVHTGEKAFKCPVCARGFNQASHLKSHMRLHTGERPYSCKLCDKSFNHNVSLKSHMQRYHPTGEEEPTLETETEKERNEENAGAAAKSKNGWIPTGRPKGRPKRNAAAKRKYAETTDESE